MNEEFTVKPVERFALIDLIIDEIGRLIAEGKLKPGDQLPSENDLSRMFNVSRTTLRQALKALDVMGVLIMNPGARTYLSFSDSKLLINPMKFMTLMHNVDLRELFETRKLVEVTLVKLAAKKASKQDIEKMDKLLVDAKNAINDREQHLHYEIKFHETIFMASGNKILTALMASINNLLLESREKTTRLMKNLDLTMKQHYEILNAIKNHDPEKAGEIMMEHLNFVESFI